MTNPRGVADHPNKAEMQTMWEEGKKAKEIYDWLVAEGLPVIKQETLARYGQRNWNDC